MGKRILSVDFDYFYPDSGPYDWSHSENRSPMLAEILWQTRSGNVNLITGASALESYVPSVPRGFWKSVLKNKPVAYVADSHLNIWDRLSSGDDVISIDAHHDCGYGEYTTFEELMDITEVDCANWGLMGRLTGRIKTLAVHYPAYRLDVPETTPSIHGKINAPSWLSATLPDPMKYDEVFICRSGAWTPPWYDDVFVKFVESSGLQVRELDDVMSERSPSLAEARLHAQNWEKMLAYFQSNKE